MDSRVREIFSKHLAASNDLNEAAAESYSELSQEALASTYEGQVVDKPVWDLLLKITRALARVKLNSAYYDNFPDVDAIEFDSAHFPDIYLLFQTWREVVVFVIEHYDQLISERLKAAVNAEEMRKVVLAGIDHQIAEQGLQTEAGNSVTVGRKEFEAMRKGLLWGFSTLMGKDNHDKFNAELKKYLASLRMYYMEAASLPNPGSKPN